MKHSPACLGLVIGALVVTSLAAARVQAQSTPTLAFISEPGDPVGQGREATVSPRIVWSDRETIVLTAFADGTTYELLLAPPSGQPLQVGVYENARGGVLSSAAHPRLEFSADGACEGSTGRFEITGIGVDAGGQVEHISANFEQRCSGAGGPLWGDLRVPPALTSVKMELERFGLQGDPDSTAYMLVECSTDARGGLTASAVQRGPGRSVVSAGTRRSFFCGASPTRVAIDLPAHPGAMRPGPVDIVVQAFVTDPHYHADGGRAVRRTVSGTVLLRPAGH